MRHNQGTKNPQNKLTDDQVVYIRDVIDYTTTSVEEVAEMYGVSRTAILKILSGETWSHLWT